MTALTQARLTSPNPYVGPRPFTRADAPNFFGRDQEARDLVSLLVAERIVLLYSPSGAGKTSLLHAKVLPDLERLRFEVLPAIRLSRVPPGGLSGLGANRYLESTYLSLGLDTPVVPPWSAAAEAEVPGVEWSSVGLAGRLKLRPPRPGKRAKVLVFDQFEEVLTLDPTDDAARDAFFREVGTALEADSCWALFAMREDYVAALEPYLYRLPTGLSTTFRLNLLSWEATRLAVVEPARRAGVEVDKEAVDYLVKDLCRVRVQRGGQVVEAEGRYVEPVQLQVVCHRLWGRLPPGKDRLTLEDVRALQPSQGQGYVDAVLADYYADTVRVIAADPALNAPERKVREWIDRHLITAHGLRGQVLRDFETTQGLPDAAIRRLEEARLVRSEERNGAVWVELTHDRLVQPIKHANDEWYEEHLHLFQLAARSWERAGRPAILVLRDGDLEEALAWAADHPGELTKTEEEFLEVGQQVQERRRGQVRRYWTLGIGVWLVAAIAILTFVIFVITEALAKARVSEAKALLSEKVARSNAMAAKALLDAEQDPEWGLFLASRALREYPESPEKQQSPAAIAVAELLARAGGRLLTGHTGPIARILVTRADAHPAAQGQPEYLISASSDRTALLWPLDPLRNSGRIDKPITLAGKGKTGHTRPIVNSALNDQRSRRRVATASVDGSARLWDLDPPGNAARVPVILKGHHGTVTKVAFFTDHQGEEWACTCGVDGQVCFWHLDHLTEHNPEAREEPKPTQRFKAQAQRITALALFGIKETRYLATASMDGTVRLWDLRRITTLAPNSGSPVGKVSYHLIEGHGEPTGDRKLPVTDLAFSRPPDRPWLVTADGGGHARLWNVTAIIEKELGTVSAADEGVSCLLTGHKQAIADIGIGADNRLLVTGDSDGVAYVWRFPALLAGFDQRRQGNAPFTADDFAVKLSGHQSSIIDIAISPRGQWVATSSEDNTARLWATAEAERPKGPKEEDYRIMLGNRIAVVTFSQGRKEDGDEQAARDDSDLLLITGCDDETVRVWRLDHLGWEKDKLRIGEDPDKRKEYLKELPVSELEHLCEEFLLRKLTSAVREEYLRKIRDDSWFSMP